MEKNRFSQILAIGMAMFAMFFGAGNSIFPLALGNYTQDKAVFAIIGLLLTGVIVPFMGLIAMVLYNGDYRAFFSRIGKVPGFILAAMIMGLIGPFGATPRCVALSYSTVKSSVPEISSLYFSLGACLLIFAFTVRKNRIMDLIGYVLTPVLLLFLGFIIVKGLLTSTVSEETGIANWHAFYEGLKEGYNTMDLLGAFFYAPVIMAAVAAKCGGSKKKLMRPMLFSSLIGALLLALTYIGFCFVAANHANGMEFISSDELIGTIAVRVVGPRAGLIASMTVALACLTTAIALTSVFADFIQKVVFRDKVSYIACLLGSIVLTFLVSTLEFSGIAAFLGPILQVCYPALIVLTVVNLFSKLFTVYSPGKLSLQE